MIRHARRGTKVHNTFLLTGAALAVLTAGCSSSSTNGTPLPPDASQSSTPDLGSSAGTGGVVSATGGGGGTVSLDASNSTAGTGGAAGPDASIDRQPAGGAEAGGTGGATSPDASTDLQPISGDGAGRDVATTELDAAMDHPAPAGQDAGVDAPGDAGGGSNADANHGSGEAGISACLGPKSSQAYLVPGLSDIAWDQDGNLITADTFYGPGQTEFGSLTMSNGGSADMFVAKINPSSGKSPWVFAAGDSLDQLATGVVATSAGLGVIGNYTGELEIESGSPIDNPSSDVPRSYIAGLTDDGTGAWNTSVNLAGGKLSSIAGQPGKDTFVVCGSAMNNAINLSTDGKTALGTPGGGFDVVVAAVKAIDGTIVWSHLFGGAMNQSCAAAALDDDGNAIFAGSYAGSLDFGLGAPLSPAPTGAQDQILWVAKFSPTGAIMAANAFGTTGGVYPTSVTADAQGNVIVAGNFQSAMSFGGTTLTPTGSTDAFVAKLDSTLAPSSWARRWGGVGGVAGCSGVGVDSMGNPIVVGSFKKMIDVGPGSTALTAVSANGNGLDVFVAKLDGSTGQTECVQGYGDSASNGELAAAVAVNRWATGANRDSVAVVGSFSVIIDFPPTLPLSGLGPSPYYGFLLLM